jgi:uncharacterized sulfatase
MPFAARAMAQANRPPNIVFVMADDLGYGDIGPYGQTKIKTPNLDRMAAEGIRFTDYYAGATVCAPSRCVLMTGKHHGHCEVRGNAREDMMVQSLKEKDQTVAQALKGAGYATAMFGKWGLGEVNEPGFPLKKGFDYFFGYLNQVHAHNYYPEFLWRNGEKVPLRNKVISNNSKYGGFSGGYATERKDYTHDMIMEEALGWLDRNHTRPFFLYVPITLPHANNEAPLTPSEYHGQEVPEYGIYANENWPEADKGQAAMITRMDRDIGRILDKLKALGVENNTLVIFTSDNGPHIEGGNDPVRFNPSGPLRGMKRDMYEGGIRAPFIARWPGKIQPGRVTGQLGYHGDLFATACEVAGLQAPAGLDSVSLVPTLLGETARQRQHEYLYWEFYEQGSAQAVRWENWKAIRKPMFDGPVELYNLAHDPGEKYNLARGKNYAPLVKKARELLDRAHTPHPNWKVSTPSA